MRSPLTANPAPTPRIACPEFGTENTRARYRGGELCDKRLRSDHPTMKSQSRWAKSVGEKYLFCGVENRPMW